MGMISKKAKTSAGKLFGVNHIYGAEDGKETVYMTRMWFGRLRFHIFFRGDQDPDCHDHPWGFWTFPLRSYVEEVLTECTMTTWRTDPVTITRVEDVKTTYSRSLRVVKAFRLHYRPATHRHRVLGAFAGWHDTLNEPQVASSFDRAVPTIVWRERPSRAWGFTKERSGKWCWVPWMDYVFNGGKAAPCQDEIE